MGLCKVYSRKGLEPEIDSKSQVSWDLTNAPAGGRHFSSIYIRAASPDAEDQSARTGTDTPES